MENGTNKSPIPWIDSTGIPGSPWIAGSSAGDKASAEDFAAKLSAAPRSFWGRTAISAGIDHAVQLLAESGLTATRRVIDVCGDGTNNAGRDVTIARDEAVAKGTTINGLPILSANPMLWNPDHTNPPGGLAKYYRDNVIGGPTAFVRVAKDFNAFGEAIIEKMVAEVSQAHRPAPQQAAR